MDTETTKYYYILEGDKDLSWQSGLHLTTDDILFFHSGLNNGGNFDWYSQLPESIRQMILKELSLYITQNEPEPVSMAAMTEIGGRFRVHYEETGEVAPISIRLWKEDKHEEDMKTLADLQKRLQEEEDVQEETEKSTGYEYVNHPKHYNLYEKEVIDMMVDIWGPDKTATWCEMTAFKYRMRMGTKPGNSIQQDLDKEKWYLDKAKELKRKYQEWKPVTFLP